MVGGASKTCVIGRSSEVLEGLVTTLVEDWSMGSILHSGIYKLANPSKVIVGLGKGWVKGIFTKSSNFPEEVAGAIDGLGGSSFVFALGIASSNSSWIGSSSSSSEMRYMCKPFLSM